MTSEEEKTDQGMEERSGVRIHVGGLGESVSRDDLLKIFAPMGSVEAVEIVRSKGRSFAYIDFSPSSHNSLTKLFSTYNGCMWKGGKLRLEKAKEHYLVRLKREWEECSKETIVSIPQEPSESELTHLKMFFPRFQKMKSLPLTGTGKHKYSFQRVEAPSVTRYFCDCEEHSASFTPQGSHCHDIEAHNPGIGKEELNIMNAVMNKLFQANNQSKDEQETETSVINEKDNESEAEEEEEEEDNLVINMVSSGNTKLPSSRNLDQTTVSRKQKSIHDEHVHPIKTKKSVPEEASGRSRTKLDIPEKIESLEADKSKPDSGVHRSNNSVSWSQKLSWKSLVANGNKSMFSVSSFLGTDSSKEEPKTDVRRSLEGSEVQEKIHAKKKKKTEKLVADDMSERKETISTETDEEAGNSAIDLPLQQSSNDEVITTEGIVSDSADDVKENAEIESEPLEGFNNSGRGSAWLQKSSWTQLVSEKNSFFSITQIVPDLIPESHGSKEINGNDDDDDDSSRVSRVIEDDAITPKVATIGDRGGVMKRKMMRARSGIGESCVFMRSAASLKGWANAKKALSEPRKKKRNEN